MNENYEEVPNIISGKDLDYLSDMFNWNYGAYKKTIDSVGKVEDEQIKYMLETASDKFHDSMITILNILNNGGNNE